MKTSLLVQSLLLLPSTLAVALPHIPKLSFKRFPNNEKRETLTEDSLSDALSSRTQPSKVAPLNQPYSQVRPRAPAGNSDRLSELAQSNHRGRPLVVSPVGDRPVGRLPPDPQAQQHNSIVGNHPFYGVGPAVQPQPLPTGSLSSNSSGTNITFFVPVPPGVTSPPIANATGTVYKESLPTSCTPRPVPEYADSNGNFLPPDQQPGYNGSISTNGSVPGECLEDPPAVAAHEIVITGEMEGNFEEVEIEIKPLSGNETGFATSTSPPLPSRTGDTGPGTRQRVPVGFTGP